MPLTIRPAVSTDLAPMLEIEQRSPNAAHWTLEQYSKLVHHGFVFLAEEDGSLGGFICGEAVAGEWEIENIVVAPEFLRHGIADQLLRRLIHQCRSEEIKKIHLEVRESNTPARRLYEKHGFLEVGRRRSYYKDPAEDAILCALSFRP